MPSQKLNDANLRILVSLVSEATVLEKEIGLDDELYYDLGIYGDPLFDLFADVARRFDVDFFSLNLNEYAPGEGAEFWRPLLVKLGHRPFKSLKVRDLWEAMNRGRWD